MKHFFIRSQLVFVSLILLATFGMMLALVIRFNYRWDWTKEKMYSLSETTVKLLEELKPGVVEVLAFYGHDDPAEKDFEIFLKQCQLHHPRFKYRFYDPDRVPRLAGELQVKDVRTVIIRYGGRQERLVMPTEQSMTNALLRLAHPKAIQLCFVTGHNESVLNGEDRNGLKIFRQALENNNYSMSEIILTRDKVPSSCHVILIVGPHRDLEKDEWNLLRSAFNEGKGVMLLVDPMDPGTGGSFHDFADELGMVLGSDVIVDKMSRMMGGDFLVPLVTQYVNEHPITREFELPTFFPVARSVQPSTQPKSGIEIVPLLFSGSGSWAETNLGALEKGEAVFEPGADLPGPICLAVSAELRSSKPASASGPDTGGRLVMVGDSDFVTNGYIELSGNQELGLKSVEWLSKDDRAVTLTPRRPEFKPLILSSEQRFVLLITTLVVYPLFFFTAGAARIFWRKRTA